MPSSKSQFVEEAADAHGMRAIAEINAAQNAVFPPFALLVCSIHQSELSIYELLHRDDV